MIFYFFLQEYDSNLNNSNDKDYDDNNDDNDDYDKDYDNNNNNNDDNSEKEEGEVEHFAVYKKCTSPLKRSWKGVGDKNKPKKIFKSKTNEELMENYKERDYKYNFNFSYNNEELIHAVMEQQKFNMQKLPNKHLDMMNHVRKDYGRLAHYVLFIERDNNGILRFFIHGDDCNTIVRVKNFFIHCPELQEINYAIVYGLNEKVFFNSCTLICLNYKPKKIKPSYIIEKNENYVSAQYYM
jgi:hypothetical protein